MLAIATRLLGKIIHKYMGKKQYQPYFETLHDWAIKGMNIGAGGGVQSSGEEAVMKFVKSQTSDEKRVIFDVGAHAGGYAESLTSIFDERTEIHSFEPSPTTFDILVKKLDKHKNIRFNQFGLSNKASEVELYSSANQTAIASVYNRRLDHFSIDLDKVETIQLSTLDDYCMMHDIQHIDFLKLDVEGHELSVLEGAKKMLSEKRVKFIQFEFGGCNIDSRTYLQDFWYALKDQYNIYRIVSDGLFPIENYQENYEVFKTSNFFAKLK